MPPIPLWLRLSGLQRLMCPPFNLATGGIGLVSDSQRTVSVEGAELFYSTRGSGPACLVLSAIGTEPYKHLTPPQLSHRLRLVYVDLRGGGRSTGEASDLTFDVLAADLEAIRVDLGLDRIAVLGHSILGVLAIEYGRRFPASVSHVVVVGTPPTGDMTLLSRQERVLLRAGRFGGTKAAVAGEPRPAAGPRVHERNLAGTDADALLRRSVRGRSALCRVGCQAWASAAHHGEADACLERQRRIELVARTHLRSSWTLRLHCSLRSVGWHRGRASQRHAPDLRAKRAPGVLRGARPVRRVAVEVDGQRQK